MNKIAHKLKDLKSTPIRQQPSITLCSELLSQAEVLETLRKLMKLSMVKLCRRSTGTVCSSSTSKQNNLKDAQFT